MLAIHEEQRAEHGGRGIRDPGLPESAPARPRTLAAHGKADLPALAAALG